MSGDERPITLAQLKALDPRHPGIDLLTGRTPLFACQADQRFSYCLYVPRDIDTSHRHPLLVSVHGTERSVQSYRDAFADLADAQQCIVLAPLFPAAVDDPNDFHNYKLIDYRGIRFDRLLLEMVTEVGVRWPAATDKFYLHGFSGGGLLLIGECDNQPHPLSASTRVASITQLRDNLLDHGLKAVLETVPGAAHEGATIFPAANRFFHELNSGAPRHTPGPTKGNEGCCRGCAPPELREC